MSVAGKSESQKSHMSEARREKLLDIQKREQLKGLLVNKFKLKYGNRPTIANYIDNEVAKFLKNDRLTEDNLKKLDEKISKETDIRDKKEAILAERRSEKGDHEVRSQASKASVPRSAASQRSKRSGHLAVAGERLETKSVASSRMSGASKLSKHSRPMSHKDDRASQRYEDDAMSLASS